MSIAENLYKLMRNEGIPVAIRDEFIKNNINELSINSLHNETRTWHLFRDGSVLVEERALEEIENGVRQFYTIDCS